MSEVLPHGCRRIYVDSLQRNFITSNLISMLTSTQARGQNRFFGRSKQKYGGQWLRAGGDLKKRSLQSQELILTPNYGKDQKMLGGNGFVLGVISKKGSLQSQDLKS